MSLGTANVRETTYGFLYITALEFMWMTKSMEGMFSLSQYFLFMVRTRKCAQCFLKIIICSLEKKGENSKDGLVLQ